MFVIQGFLCCRPLIEKIYDTRWENIFLLIFKKIFIVHNILCNNPCPPPLAQIYMFMTHMFFQKHCTMFIVIVQQPFTFPLGQNPSILFHQNNVTQNILHHLWLQKLISTPSLINKKTQITYCVTPRAPNLLLANKSGASNAQVPSTSTLDVLYNSRQLI